MHALLGENGAGKSTLSNILTGLYHPDEGEILLGDKQVTFASPRDALDAGICMVHQHFRLVAPFTVAENVMLGDHRGEGKKFLVHPRRIERNVAELGERYRIAVDPRARIWQLSLGEQQRVEILKALYRQAQILILDEPTAVLTPQEADSLFETLRVMALEGRTIVFISHKLHEVKAVSDRVDGPARRQERRDRRDQGLDGSLARLAHGRTRVGRRRARVARVDGRRAGARTARSLGGGRPRRRRGSRCHAGGGRRGDRRDCRRRRQRSAGAGRDRHRHARRDPRPGDGRRTPTAARRPARGDQGRRRTRARGQAAHRRRAVAADRVERGPQDLSRRDASRGPLLRLRAIRELAVALIKRYDVRGGGPELPARQLSGGNLQKVVLAREFHGRPRALVVASPTRGLDVAAIETVHGYLRQAAADGVGVLLISEDLDEILGPGRPDRSSLRGSGRRRDGRGERHRRRARPADGGRLGRVIRIERRLEQPRWLSIAVPVGSILIAFVVMTVVLAGHASPAAGNVPQAVRQRVHRADALNATFVAATPLVFTGLAPQSPSGCSCSTSAVKVSSTRCDPRCRCRPSPSATHSGGSHPGDGRSRDGRRRCARALPAVLRAYLKTNEIITSLMLNYVAALFLNYLIFDSLSYWRDTSSATARFFRRARTCRRRRTGRRRTWGSSCCRSGC